MNALEVRGISAVVSGLVKEYVEKASGELERKFEAYVAKRIESLPAGPQGEKGDPGESIRGEQGEPGPEGSKGDQGNPGERGSDGQKGEAGPPGPAGEKGTDGRNGKDGRDGKDADMVAVGELIQAEVALAVAALPAPKDGNDGRDGKDGIDGRNVDMAEVREKIAADLAIAVAAIPVPKDGASGAPGKDGESIHPDTVALMVRDAVSKALDAQPKPKDGEPGRDAIQIDILPEVTGGKAYARNTYARHQGGIIRSIRSTEAHPADNPKDWEVVVDGLADIQVKQLEDLRTFHVELTRTGGTVQVQTFVIPVPLDQGIFKDGQEYRRGDVVTFSNSGWICQVDATKERPGTSKDWRLMVREGRAGKDFKPTENGNGEPKPVRLK